jgi:magnesium-transporting ATPase (P-type)
MLVIIVGGIPIAMPTVLSVTLALGAYRLAKEGAIVARMSAVEEMAGMDVLCSDKTGTLTLNKLSIETQSVLSCSGMPISECMKYAALSANTITEEPIDMVLFESYPEAVSDVLLAEQWLLFVVDQGSTSMLAPHATVMETKQSVLSPSAGRQTRMLNSDGCFWIFTHWSGTPCLCTYLGPLQKNLKDRYKTIKFIPFNPVDKFTCATVLDTQTNKCIRLLKGSPQVSQQHHRVCTAITAQLVLP